MKKQTAIKYAEFMTDRVYYDVWAQNDYGTWGVFIRKHRGVYAYMTVKSLKASKTYKEAASSRRK